MENSPATLTVGESDEGRAYCAFSASLRISGAIPDIEAITRQLRLHPTHVHREGKTRSAGASPYQTDMWIYEAQVDESEPLDRHIADLWNRLRDHKAFILGLKTNRAFNSITTGPVTFAS